MNRAIVAIIAASVVSLAAVQAMAGVENHLTVPEPTTLSLISGGVALAIVGARWFRRK